MFQIKSALTMPADVADDLLHSLSRESAKARPHRSPARLIAMTAILCLCIGSTSLAYNVYQEKQLAIFMEHSLTQEEINALGLEISENVGVSFCTYITGDEAWKEFQETYFSDDEEMRAWAASLDENPLADSFNYRVSIHLNADTEAVREELSRLPGVRRITTIREAEAEADADRLQ